MSGCEN